MFEFHAFNRARIAHGVLMSLAIIVFFPMGGVLVRLLSSPRTVRIHMLCQIIGLGILVAGFGLGLRIQEQIHIEWTDPHQTLGTTLVALFLCMPFIGAISHWRSRKTGKKPVLGYLHVWVGRIVITISLVNGGLGLRLAEESSGGEISYAVLAAVVATVYGAMLVWWYFFNSRAGKRAAPAPAAEVELETQIR